jgi:NAD(P)-dependent dehydrogenase (short-subunit alcohol dehydrogenase family)
MKVFVTGANRGIGLEFVKQLKALNFEVFASTRSKFQDSGLENIIPPENHFVLDTGSHDSIVEFGKQIEQKKVVLDIFINNAGMLKNIALDNPDLYESTLLHFKVNALGPLAITQELVNRNLLKNGSKIIMITSQMASIEDNGMGAYYGYRMSKTALNSGMKSLSIDLKPKGHLVLAIHPGWVVTDMGGKNAKVTAKDSVSDMINLIQKMDESQSGTFVTRTGEVLPW